MIPNGERSCAEDYKIPDESHHVLGERSQVIMDVFHLPYSVFPCHAGRRAYAVERYKVNGCPYIDLESNTADGDDSRIQHSGVSF